MLKRKLLIITGGLNCNEVMAKIFVAYADERYKESLNRIKRQAKRTHRFDRILLYTPKDLPEYIKASPLFAFSRGGGYWVWKPYVVMDALSKCQEGDIVCYADSGCSLNKDSEEWDVFFAALEKHNAIFFQYRADFSYPGWDKICKNPQNNSTAIRHWMKPLTKTYFEEYFGSDSFCDFSKIMGTIFFIKKTTPLINVIREWYNLALFHPILFMDPIGKETTSLPDDFNVHRHDQAVLTPLIYYYKCIDQVLVLPETSESDKTHAAIIASRFIQREMPLWLYIKYRIYHFIYGE